MRVGVPRITYDKHGTPGLWASNPTEAWMGLGFLHGCHRPLQALLLGAAGRGVLAKTLAPRADLVALDALIHRLDLPTRGRVEAERLNGQVAEWLDAYLVGFAHGLHHGGQPVELRLLAARLPPLDRSAVLSGLLAGAYLGHAEGQERMERALVDALAAGADPDLLATMFHPHLDGWQADRLKRLARRPGLGLAAHGLLGAGGSNAWVVDGTRTACGKPLLCGDPHLVVSQLPALFFEVRARVGEQVWLGATIPGLPGWVVGRNRRLAWSSTFACADNVDFVIETLEDGRVRRPQGWRESVIREVEIGRRFRSPVRVRFRVSDHGVLEDCRDGETLAVQWCGARGAADMLAAYLRLPTASTAAQAERLLERASVYSLHYVLADSSGEIRYCQGGRVPRRSAGWSGLFPVDSLGAAKWAGFYEGSALPRERGERGLLVSANEARPAPDGGTLATLAQPDYRQRRITSLLLQRTDHDRASMQSIQADVLSLQGARLAPILCDALADGPILRALRAWDGTYTADSVGAHAFEIAYRAALRGLETHLGGAWLRHMLDNSELPVWWCAAFDRLLASPRASQSELGQRVRSSVARASHDELGTWGDVQRFVASHVLFGGLPRAFGFDRGPFPLEGSRATIRQGNLVTMGGHTTAVGQAFRMVCDLGGDSVWTSLAGGVDGSPFSPSYACWLDDWKNLVYHELTPPADQERS